MSEPQPVVLSLLKLPPPLQPFFRLKEIFHIFREKLEQLTLTLAATQDPEGPDAGLASKFLKTLMPLRSKAGAQVSSFTARLLVSGMSAKVMVDFVDSFPLTFVGPDTPRPFRHIRASIRSQRDGWEETVKGMEELNSDILSTVERIRTMIEQSKDIRELSIFNEENSQVVNELIQTTQEASSILHKHAQYWNDLVIYFQDSEPFRLQSPPREEVAFVRESWTAYSRDLADLKSNPERREC